jgi:hypothetical protein
MSQKEIKRLEVMQKLAEKRMSQKEAGTLLGLGVRHYFRSRLVTTQSGGAICKAALPSKCC